MQPYKRAASTGSRRSAGSQRPVGLLRHGLDTLQENEGIDPLDNPEGVGSQGSSEQAFSGNVGIAHAWQNAAAGVQAQAALHRNLLDDGSAILLDDDAILTMHALVRRVLESLRA